MKIIMVRHGLTTANIEGKFSTPDTKLSDKGLYILDKTKTLLKDYEISKVFTSELARSQETARLLGFEDFTPDERINEINFGSFRGRLLAEVRENEQDFYQREGADYFNTAFPDGESRRYLIERVGDFLDDVSRTYEGNILCISHGIAIRASLFWVLKDLDNWNYFWIDNGSLTVFNIVNDKKIIESVNKI